MQAVMNRENGAQWCDNALKIFQSMQARDGGTRTKSDQEEKGIFVF